MIAITVLLFAILAAAVAAAVFRLGDALRRGQEARTRLVARRREDRRQRKVPVAVERRAGPRRHDDIARQFLLEAEAGDRHTCHLSRTRARRV